MSAKLKQLLEFDGEGKAVTAGSTRRAKRRKETEVVKNGVNGQFSTVEVHPIGSKEPVHIVKDAPAKEKAKAKPKAPKESKSLRVNVDYKMPTLRQVAEFVAAEAEKGTKSLTAARVRARFKVPGKIPMVFRFQQLERAGFGKLGKVEGVNTVAVDMGAVASGTAALKGKEPKPKAEVK
jgi:hypothetical protein